PVLISAGWFGGTLSSEEGTAIATDGSGTAYITGITDSDDFPIGPGAKLTASFGKRSFVTKVNAANGVLYSSLIDGQTSGIAVDQSGCAYVIASIYTGNHVGLAEGIQITKLSPAGDSIIYQTSLPGPGLGRGIALDAQGNAYITGSTRARNFPV